MPCLNRASCSTRPQAHQRSNFAGRQPASGSVPAGTWAEPFRLMGCTGFCRVRRPHRKVPSAEDPPCGGLLPTAKTTLNPAYGQLKICLQQGLRLDDPSWRLLRRGTGVKSGRAGRSSRLTGTRFCMSPSDAIGSTDQGVGRMVACRKGFCFWFVLVETVLSRIRRTGCFQAAPALGCLLELTAHRANDHAATALRSWLAS
jgi:hypothetical protein